MTKKRHHRSSFQKIFIFFLIFILPVFICKQSGLLTSKKEGSLPPKNEYYHTFVQKHEKKHFVVVVSSLNHAKFIERCLNSVFDQNYPFFRLICIDKGSEDGTLKIIKAICRDKKKKGLFTLFEEKSAEQGTHAYHQAIHECQDDEVIVHLDAKDWLLGQDVLSKLNQVYSNPDVMLTYGQYLEYPSYKKGILNPLPKKILYKKKVQRAPWVMAPLKTFYAGIFKKVEIDKFQIKDEKAFLLPLAEMAKNHVRFIPDVLYIHDSGSKQSSLHLGTVGENLTRSFNQNAPICRDVETQKADLIIFSHNSPDRLSKCLNSVVKNLHGVNRIQVIYTCKDEQLKKYEEIQMRYPDVHFLKGKNQQFKSLVMDVLFEKQATTDYVLLATDEIEIHEDIKCHTCIEAMKKNDAYGFYLHFGKKTGERASFLQEKIYTLPIDKMETLFKDSPELHCAFYKRDALKRDFSLMEFHSLSSLIKAWSGLNHSDHRALFYEKAKAFSNKELIE